MTDKMFKIHFHGITAFSGEDAKDAISNFLAQAETVSEYFIIDDVKEMEKVYSVKIEAGTAVEIITDEVPE